MSFIIDFVKSYMILFSIALTPNKLLMEYLDHILATNTYLKYSYLVFLFVFQEGITEDIVREAISLKKKAV